VLDGHPRPVTIHTSVFSWYAVLEGGGLQEEDGSGHAGIARVGRLLSAFWQDPDWSLLPMVAYCLLSL
jgi:hypothetical protein